MKYILSYWHNQLMRGGKQSGVVAIVTENGTMIDWFTTRRHAMTAMQKIGDSKGILSLIRINPILVQRS